MENVWCWGQRDVKCLITDITMSSAKVCLNDTFVSRIQCQLMSSHTHFLIYQHSSSATVQQTLDSEFKTLLFSNLFIYF